MRDAAAAATAAAAAASLVAFDLMAINLGDLRGLPELMPRLSHYFACESRHGQLQQEASLATQIARSERLERELQQQQHEQAEHGAEQSS